MNSGSLSVAVKMHDLVIQCRASSTMQKGYVMGSQGCEDSQKVPFTVRMVSFQTVLPYARKGAHNCCGTLCERTSFFLLSTITDSPLLSSSTVKSDLQLNMIPTHLLTASLHIAPHMVQVFFFFFGCVQRTNSLLTSCW